MLAVHLCLRSANATREVMNGPESALFGLENGARITATGSTSCWTLCAMRLKGCPKAKSRLLPSLQRHPGCQAPQLGLQCLLAKQRCATSVEASAACPRQFPYSNASVAYNFYVLRAQCCSKLSFDSKWVPQTHFGDVAMNC